MRCCSAVRDSDCDHGLGGFLRKLRPWEAFHAKAQPLPRYEAGIFDGWDSLRAREQVLHIFELDEYVASST
jgi:hypothetical protein